MAGTGVNLAQRVHALLGDHAIVESGAVPLRVAPRNEDALALLMRTATDACWSVAVAGAGTWMPPGAPADLVVTTTHLSEVSFASPSDLVVTAGAGLSWDALRAELAERGAWVAVDPPGRGRSVGSVLATGTAGPLRSSYGNVRDHVLGLTMVTGDGRVLRPGGIVVKNVAGFDLPKLATGSFGAFGIVSSVALRLRTVPRADVTLVGSGARDELVGAAREVLAGGLTPAALELASPAALGTADWGVAVRLTGSSAEVAATRDAVRGSTGVDLVELGVEEAARFWQLLHTGPLLGSTTIRLGALSSSLESVLDLLTHHLREAWTTASVTVGGIRWSGTADPDELRLLRHTAAQQEIPLTIERAPWAIRARLGHFGAYREGAGMLVSGLRKAFDPAGVLVAPLGIET